MTSTTAASHVWKFARSGGLDQVSLESGSDLESLRELDLKLWVALSCPVKGLQIDERTLSLIDTDQDGQVRPPEVIAAVSWACARLKDPSDLLTGGPQFPIGAVSAKPEGAAVAEAAGWILAMLGKSGATVSAEDASQAATALSKGALKGDGSLRADAGRDDSTRALISDIITCCGSATEKTVADFYADMEAFVAWSDAGGSTASGLGNVAAEAFAAMAAVRAKVADYFARIELATFDPSAIEGLNRHDDEYKAIAAGELALNSQVLAALPLARIEPGKALPLVEGVNPAWAAGLARLRDSAVAPLLGAGVRSLTANDWAVLVQRLQPYEAWVVKRPATSVASLGIDRIRAILGSEGRKALAELFAEDKTLAPRVTAAHDVEKLALLYRDLGTILRNFVNFSDFYSRTRPAMFLAGTLYIDSRSCRLCVKVDNIDAHATFAEMSRVYVAYLECRRPGGETMKIAAGITQGDSDYLFVGRNGVFYDRKGRDWTASVVRITTNPISIRQAFFSPYKKVASFVQAQFAKFAASKDQAATANLTAAATPPPAAPAGPGLAAPTPPATATGNSSSFDIAKFAGIFAAIGLAFGAVGGAIASIVSGLLTLPRWEIPIAIAAALLLVSGPAMILAALKLRQRTLGPILEGTGWAVNGRVKINFPLGVALTDRGVLPPNARHLARDPFADEAAKTRRRVLVTLVIVAIAWLLFARLFHFWPFPGVSASPGSYDSL